MKKYLYVFAVSLLFISGCASNSSGLLGVKDDGELKEQYEPPLAIDDAPISEQALIKAADNLIIVKVDGERYSNFAKVMIGQGVTSVRVREGEHTIMGSLGVDLNIGRVYYKKGHEYFIDYAKRHPKIHYWVEDLTENKIVYGKKID